MKRIYRNDMSTAQRMKLSRANIGKRLSQDTKDKISKSMEEYWSSLPYKPGTPSGTPDTETDSPFDEE